LSPRYIGPYEIIEKLNPIAYPLDLPVELEHVHNVYHISQLRKYIPDPDHTIVSEPIEITEDLVHEDRPIQILIVGSSSCTTSRYHWSKYSRQITPPKKPLGKPKRQ